MRHDSVTGFLSSLSNFINSILTGGSSKKSRYFQCYWRGNIICHVQCCLRCQNNKIFIIMDSVESELLSTCTNSTLFSPLCSLLSIICELLQAPDHCNFSHPSLSLDSATTFFRHLQALVAGITMKISKIEFLGIFPKFLCKIRSCLAVPWLSCRYIFTPAVLRFFTDISSFVNSSSCLLCRFISWFQL